MDSTVLDDAVATQDTVTQLIGAIRAVIREVPGAAGVASVHCVAHDYGDPGKLRIAWNDEQARADLVDALVGDALRLLGHLPEQGLDDRATGAVGLLALVAGQDVEPADGSDGRDGRWRISKATVPDRVVSTVDPQTRHVHKTRSHYQDGYAATPTEPSRNWPGCSAGNIMTSGTKARPSGTTWSASWLGGVRRCGRERSVAWADGSRNA